MENDNTFQLLEAIVYIRRVEEKICELYSEQQMRCPVHISIGQEAIAVGICKNLRDEDMIFSNHRSHAHYLAKGGDLKRFFAEIYGKITGCAKGRGGSMHLVDLSVNFMGSTPIVGGVIPIATGAAFAVSMKNLDKIVVIFIGDGAVEEGVFHESINFAKLKNLPILFVCENNQYSVYTPLKLRQPKRNILDIANGHGLNCFKMDGNNVLGVYQAAKDIINKIRCGSGPWFIEAATYRFKEHCGPNYDNHLGYRSKEEFQSWELRDPLKLIKEYMINKKILNEVKLNMIIKKIDQEILDAVKFAKDSPFPDKSELVRNVYAK